MVVRSPVYDIRYLLNENFPNLDFPWQHLQILLQLHKNFSKMGQKSLPYLEKAQFEKATLVISS